MTDRAREYLESMAPLPSFWIYRSVSVAPGLIHYQSLDGQIWTLMEDNEALLDECLQLLLDNDCIVFTEDKTMMSHIEHLIKAGNTDSRSQ